MAFKGSFAALRKHIDDLHEVASGKFVEEARRLAGDVAYKTAVEGWRAGISPYGGRWVGARGRPLTLIKTGSLFRSMQLERSPLGVRIVIGGPQFGRHSLATIFEYGGRILSGRTRAFAVRSERARRAAVRAGMISWEQISAYARERTARAMKRVEAAPMTFRVPGGWRSAHGVEIRAAPMLPRGKNEVPPLWDKAIGREIEALGKRRLGKG